MKIAYLAPPYSDPDPEVKQWRCCIATKVAFELMQQGIFVYSPLTHNIPIDRPCEWIAFNQDVCS